MEISPDFEMDVDDALDGRQEKRGLGVAMREGKITEGEYQSRTLRFSTGTDSFGADVQPPEKKVEETKSARRAVTSEMEVDHAL